jgi:hypothetical protein
MTQRFLQVSTLGAASNGLAPRVQPANEGIPLLLLFADRRGILRGGFNNEAQRQSERKVDGMG